MEQVSAGDPVRRAQYLDFIRNGTFRSSILTHVQRATEVQAKISLQQFRQLHFILPRYKRMEVAEDTASTYQSGQYALDGRNPQMRRLFDLFGRLSPGPWSYQQLTAAVKRENIALPGPLDTFLMDEIARGSIWLWTSPAGPQRQSADRQPVTRPCLTQAQKQLRQALPFLVDPIHDHWQPTPLAECVLSRLDGQHDIHQLVAAIQMDLQQGRLIPLDGEHGLSEQELGRQVRRVLDKLQRRGMLCLF